MITTEQAIKKYGKPNQQGTYLVSIKLPYPMRLAWDKNTKVTTMRCHKAAADRFLLVFNDLFSIVIQELFPETCLREFNINCTDPFFFKLQKNYSCLSGSS